MEFVSITQAMKELGGVSRTTMYRLINAGKFDVFRLSPQAEYKIVKASLEKFKATCLRKATAYGKIS